MVNPIHFSLRPTKSNFIVSEFGSRSFKDSAFDSPGKHLEDSAGSCSKALLD